MENHNNMKYTLLLIAFFLAQLSFGKENLKIELNGTWEYGINRNYSAECQVPGITLNPKEITPGTLWYRRNVSLPEGGWNSAVLELKGARFRPQVYVDGTLVSSSEGGMVRTLHHLEGVEPGKTISLEVALASLEDVPLEDASCIPAVDRWRSNCSSCLWDDVVLHLYKDAYVDRVLTFPDLKRKKATLKYRVNGNGAAGARIRISDKGKDLIAAEGPAENGENEIVIAYRGLLREWTPETPNCYKLCVELVSDDGFVLSRHEQTFGLKTFAVKNKQFRLNGKPCRVRGGSIVWHRWVRDENAREINYDTLWYDRHVVSEIKDRGGNYLRFHLGLPPERMLDLCDQRGLLVQYEWSFFHGMPASLESLNDQYAKWLDMASRHPSIALYHPYNETSPEELERVWTSLDSLCAIHPPIVLEERDVNHVHRYWWGMSENLGLYYDSYKQFLQPIMVDEFGGFYLDEQGNLGAYPMLPSAVKRWLASNDTLDERLYQQNLATGKLGEYWRRLGAAGIGAFAIASSFEDGNNWYMGNIDEGNLKPVWNALTPVWAPRVVSMDIWNRNFSPGQKYKIPLHFINDTDHISKLKARLQIIDSEGKAVYSKDISRWVLPHKKRIGRIRVLMPEIPGGYTIKCTLINPEPELKHEVVSSWKVRVLNAIVPEKLAESKVFVPVEEKELTAMAVKVGLKLVDNVQEADIILGGLSVWKNIYRYNDILNEAVMKGASVVLLSAGERFLGKQYDDNQSGLGHVVRPTQTSTEVISTKLFAGLTLNSAIHFEGESHIHPYEDNQELWFNLDPYNTRLWNGLRGGLIVPSADLDIQGLSQEAFLNQWVAKGADTDKIKTGPYYAYDHCGFYEYSDSGNDEIIKKRLKDKVFFLIQDMPALDLSLDKNSPVFVTDLHAGFESNASGRAEEFIPLVSAGKDLVRNPVIKIRFSEEEGCLIISQLLTEGRLAKGYAQKRKKYTAEYDEAAVQFVMNIMESALNK